MGGEGSRNAASVLALYQALSMFDPKLGRAALSRAEHVDQLARHISLAATPHHGAVLAALVADVAVLATHDDSADTSAAAVLAATLLGSIHGLDDVALAVRHRREQFDGSGRPAGLAGTSIPIAARLLATADALTDHQAADLEDQGSLDPELIATAKTMQWSGADRTAEEIVAMLPPITSPITGTPTSPADPLDTITQIIGAIGRIEEVLALIAEKALDMLYASTVSIARLDLEQGFLQVLVNVGHLGAGDERFPLDELYSIADLPELEDYRRGQTRLHRASLANEHEARYLAGRGLSSEAVVPIMIDDTAWGIVWATSFEGHPELDLTSVASLRKVAHRMASGVDRSSRFDELERLSFHDPLTGLGNRRILDQKLSEIFARPPAERRAAVIMCDVDNLKVVNDHQGHEAGDETLVAAARALETAAKPLPDAVVCRIGGDEFCVVIEGEHAARAQEIADLALDVFRGGRAGRSMSCGVATTSKQIATSSDLLRAADQAQYATKKRHRVEAQSGRSVAPPVAGSLGRRERRDSSD